MSARDDIRRAVAAEFQRLDAHQFGYDHGFCADPAADPETAAFVDAAIRIVLRQAVALVSLHVDLGAPPQRILTELRRMAGTNTTQET
jgi:hypothetical protein